ncbi:hypothetical protein ACO1O0_005947 [Amphichorda felina]
MGDMDAAGLALNVATICSKLAWNLYKFVHKVKEAPEQARQMQHSLVALKKCLDKITSLFAFQRPLDPQEVSFRDSIYEILEFISLDLKTLRTKFRINGLLAVDNQRSFKTVKIVFSRLFEEGDIVEIQARIGQHERLLQTHFEMLILWKTQKKVDKLSGAVEEYFIRLHEDAKSITARPRVISTTRSEMSESEPGIEEISESESIRKYHGAVWLWQTRSRDIVEWVTNGNSRRERGPPNAPSVLDEDTNGDDLSSDYTYPEGDDLGGFSEPELLSPDPLENGQDRSTTPRSSISQPKPEERARQDQLEKALQIFRSKTADMLEDQKLSEAKKHQQEAIDVLTELKEFRDVPFSEEFEMKEKLANIHIRMDVPEAIAEAHEVMRKLVRQEDELQQNGSPERRSRLYQTLSGIQLRLGKFSEACNSAMAAAYTRLEANPNGLSPEETELVKEAARTCYRAAMHIPDTKKAYGTFHDIAYKLGDPTFIPPENPYDANTIEWCRKQGFQVDKEGFGYHVCATNVSEAVRILLDKGASVGAKDCAGMNGLHRCQTSVPGGTEIARLLLKHTKSGWMDIEEKDHNGKTAVHLAAQMGNVPMLEFLLNPKRGADPNARQSDGSTPIMVAVLSSIDNKKNVVNVLLENKADISIQNKNQQTVQDIAKRQGEKTLTHSEENRGEEANHKTSCQIHRKLYKGDASAHTANSMSQDMIKSPS